MYILHTTDCLYMLDIYIITLFLNFTENHYHQHRHVHYNNILIGENNTANLQGKLDMVCFGHEEVRGL